MADNVLEIQAGTTGPQQIANPAPNVAPAVISTTAPDADAATPADGAMVMKWVAGLGALYGASRLLEAHQSKKPVARELKRRRAMGTRRGNREPALDGLHLSAMTRKQKAVLLIGGVAVVGGAAFVLWPSSAHAASAAPPPPPIVPGKDASGTVTLPVGIPSGAITTSTPIDAGSKVVAAAAAAGVKAVPIYDITPKAPPTTPQAIAAAAAAAKADFHVVLPTSMIDTTTGAVRPITPEEKRAASLKAAGF